MNYMKAMDTLCVNPGGTTPLIYECFVLLREKKQTWRSESLMKAFPLWHNLLEKK